jgi:CRP/FNR family transcriptional regulator, anaerobic regulatory protein
MPSSNPTLLHLVHPRQPAATVPPPFAPGRGFDPVGDMLSLLAGQLGVRVQSVHAGDTLCSAGRPFAHLYVVHAGCFKTTSCAADGRHQVVALQFRGDWLGFDGMASGRHACDTIAMDVDEVWGLRYEELMQACARTPALMAGLHREMGLAIQRARDAMLSRCTLPATSRVAEFLAAWATSLAGRGQRAEQITLRMTRAEIGSHLGMTLESVSRALGSLVRSRLIRFTEQGRRVIFIPDLHALTAFGQSVSGGLSARGS